MKVKMPVKMPASKCNSFQTTTKLWEIAALKIIILKSSFVYLKLGVEEILKHFFKC